MQIKLRSIIYKSYRKPIGQSKLNLTGKEQDL
jgi:hypothetical protein